MNKKLVGGIIAAILIAIAITTIIYYNNISSNVDETDTKITNESATTGKKFTLELSEKVGISEHP